MPRLGVGLLGLDGTQFIGELANDDSNSVQPQCVTIASHGSFGADGKSWKILSEFTPTVLL